MDVAGQNALGIVQDDTGIIGEDHFHLCALFLDQVGVILNVVHQGEGVQVLAEQGAVALQSQDVGEGIDLGFVQLVQGHQLVAHLVGGVAEHQDDLLGAAGDTTQADGEAVTGQDGENDAHGLAAQLGADIGGNGIHGGVVALCAGHDGLGQRHNITVANFIAFTLGSFQNAVDSNFGQIVALTDDGAADTSGYGSDFSFHNNTSFPRPGCASVGIESKEHHSYTAIPPDFQ